MTPETQSGRAWWRGCACGGVHGGNRGGGDRGWGQGLGVVPGWAWHVSVSSGKDPQHRTGHQGRSLLQVFARLPAQLGNFQLQF